MKIESVSWPPPSLQLKPKPEIQECYREDCPHSTIKSQTRKYWNNSLLQFLGFSIYETKLIITSLIVFVEHLEDEKYCPWFTKNCEHPIIFVTLFSTLPFQPTWHRWQTFFFFLVDCKVFGAGTGIFCMFVQHLAQQRSWTRWPLGSTAVWTNNKSHRQDCFHEIFNSSPGAELR